MGLTVMVDRVNSLLNVTCGEPIYQDLLAAQALPLLRRSRQLFGRMVDIFFRFDKICHKFTFPPSFMVLHSGVLTLLLAWSKLSLHG